MLRQRDTAGDGAEPADRLVGGADVYVRLLNPWLTEEGLVERVYHAEITPRVEYHLTDKGREVEPVIRALADWGGGRPRP